MYWPHNQKEEEIQCDGVIIHNAGPFNDDIKCISRFAYNMCEAPNINFLILLGTLLFINIFFFSLASCCKKLRSPTCSFIVSLIQNVIFSAIVLDITCLSSLGPSGLYMGTLFPLIFSVIPINLITYSTRVACCSRKPAKTYKYRQLMFPDKKDLENSMDDIESYIHKGCSNPPMIKIQGVCTMRMQFGTKTRLMFERYLDFLPYESWENNTELPELKNGTLAIVRLDTDYTLSPTLETNLSMRKQHLRDEAEKAGFEFNSDKVSYKVYNCKKMHVISNGNCFFKFLNSCFGKFLFVLSHVAGLQSIIENIFGMSVSYYDIKVKRTISDTKDLSNLYLCADTKITGGENCENPPLSVVPHANMYAGQAMANNIYQSTVPQVGVVPNQVMAGNQQMMVNQTNGMIMPSPGMPNPMQANQVMMQQPGNGMVMQNPGMPNPMVAQNDQMTQLQQQNQLLQQQIQLQQQQLQQMQQMQQLQLQQQQMQQANNDDENPYIDP